MLNNLFGTDAANVAVLKVPEELFTYGAFFVDHFDVGLVRETNCPLLNPV